MVKKVAAWVVLVSFLLASPGFAQNIRPFTALRVIKTDRFDIIFPERSRRTAEALATFADSTYARVSSLLGIEVNGRIPVTVTPDTDVFNGYMNAFPYPHIVLYDTPMDIEWTTFRNSLEGIFLHELTHAVSLSSRGPFFDSLHGIFGGWVLPAGLTAPLFMVEGVTVSFESLDGFGRANDPVVKERLRQAIHEGAFLTPFQASGVYDKPPLGNAYYEYGGLFSAYLQRTYGMERYATLWRELGRRIPVSLSLDRHGFNRIFLDVYGLPVQEAWAAFAASLALGGIEENEDRVSGGAESIIASVASGGGRVFVLDRVESAVDMVDPVTGERRRIKRTDAADTDIDVTPDGSRLIVAGYRFAGSLAAASAVEYDIATGRRTGRTWAGLYRPRYFRDGIVGIASDLHANRIVYRDASGAESVLLEGNDEVLFSAPAPIDADRFAFIVSDRGIRRLGIYDFAAGRAAIVKSDLPDDADRWKYARDLRFSEGRLLFSYDHDDRFYKLAVIRDLSGDEPTASFASRDFSGGVFAPVAVGDAIVYRAAFSTWDALMRYPERLGGLTGTTAKLRLEYLAIDGGSGDATGAEGNVFPERAYSGLPYLNPLKLWFPMPLVRTGAQNFRVDGGGIGTYLSTPTDANTFLAFAGYDAVAGMGYFDVTWNSLSIGTPLVVRASDGIEFVEGEGLDFPYRATRASVEALFIGGIGGERTRLIAAPSLEAAWIAPGDDESGGAYAWRYLDGEYAAGITFGLSTFRRFPWRLFGNGFSFTSRARLSFPSQEPRADGMLRIAAESALPLRLTLYGSWDRGGQELDGHTARYGDSLFASSASGEYADEAGGGLRWVSGGELEFRVFSKEIQRNLSHLYFNRLFGILAWRGAVYDALNGTEADPPGSPVGTDALFVQSVVAKAGAVISAIPAAMVPIRFSPYAWAALKVSDLYDGTSENGFAFGLAFSVEW